MTTPSETVEIAVVVPFYNEIESVPVLFATLLPILRGLNTSFEVICVNDGSTDGTLQALLEQRQVEPRIVVIDFSRNFGKEAALQAGLDEARGQALIPMDCDLQDPPTLLPELVRRWREGFEVVHAQRSSYADPLPKRLTSALYYRLLQLLTRVPIPRNVGDFRLIDRRVIDIVRSLPERQRFMRGLVAWAGFRTSIVHYDRPGRAAGQTKYNWARMWNAGLDGITSLSMFPLKIWTLIGVVVSLLSFLYAIAIVTLTLFHGVEVAGYASLIVVVLFLGGLQLIGIGLLGEYLGRTYMEAKQRPAYVTRSIYR